VAKHRLERRCRFGFASDGHATEFPRLDASGKRSAARVSSVIRIRARARRLVESMALVLQGSLLVRFGDPAVADAFLSSRLAGDWGNTFGTLSSDTPFAAIIERAAPQRRTLTPGR